jgi:predicted SAM-dependent methyltransferase
MTPEQAQTMKAIKDAAKGKKLLLHVGCGTANPNKIHEAFRGEEWFELRFDIDAKVQPHIVGDLTDLSMLPDGAVDGIFSSHNLEHLMPHQVVDALKGFHRVLMWGGELIIATPDLQTAAAFVATGKLEDPIYTSPAGPIAAIDILYGLRSSVAKGNHFMAHKTGFTHKTLAQKLVDAGFSNITITRDRFDLEARSRKLQGNHTQRREKVVLQVTDRYNPREAVAVTVDKLADLPHPGGLWKGKMADELDVPPTPLT